MVIADHEWARLLNLKTEPYRISHATLEKIGYAKNGNWTPASAENGSTMTSLGQAVQRQGHRQPGQFSKK